MSDELIHETSDSEGPRREWPHATHERWQPLRSGVLNIFKYDEEEFWFDDGRLLLRGNNGAGKSRILALQLPFLLDGEMASHRIEPDGDPAKRMEWNLLMNRYEQRLGYTWIEFGRRDLDGAEHFITLGCGMHARKGTGIPPNSRWFFVTSQRIGTTLQLMSENRVPHNRERLEAALGREGTVYRSARDYRAAVDAALFGLGARYGPLIELLLQLRKPQIMRDFKADDLSRLLSEALPPLSPGLIDNVSVSFRSLESDRQQLTDLSDAREGVETFLKSYQHYVRVAVRRRAADVRATHSRYEGAQREISRLADQREENATALSMAEVEEKRVGKALVTARATERTLLDSPEMKSVEDLRRAKEAWDERSKQATTTDDLLAKSQETLDRMSGERVEAQTAVSRQKNLVSKGETALSEAYEKAALPLPLVIDTQEKFDAILHGRVQQIGLLRAKNDVLTKAVDHRKKEETRLEQRREDLVRCEEAEIAARNAREEALDALVAGIYTWEKSLEVLPMSSSDDWRVLFETWLDLADGPSPLNQRIDVAYQSATQSLSNERSQCERALAERTEERTHLADELYTLLSGQQPEPPTPYTRAVNVRTDRPGAPLWKLCGFKDEITAEDRAGYEAALEAAGLLDAWLTPEGVLIDPATQDVYFYAARGQPDAGLNRVLRAEGDFAEVVAGILGCIGSAEDQGETWVSASGRWRHHLLGGTWQKSRAEYLGHTLREESRLRRISELESAVAKLDEIIQDLTLNQRSIEDRNTRLAAEREGAPNIGLLQRTVHTLESAEAESAGARTRLEEIDQLLARTRIIESEAQANRDRDAADLGLSAWKEPEALDTLEELLGDVRLKAAMLWPALEALRHAQTALQKATAHEEEARSSLEAASIRALEARKFATDAEASYATLHQMVGTTADQVLQHLAKVRGELERLVKDEEVARKSVGDLRVNEAVIVKDAERAETDRASHEQTRADTSRRCPKIATFCGEKTTRRSR